MGDSGLHVHEHPCGARRGCSGIQAHGDRIEGVAGVHAPAFVERRSATSSGDRRAPASGAAAGSDPPPPSPPRERQAEVPRPASTGRPFAEALGDMLTSYLGEAPEGPSVTTTTLDDAIGKQAEVEAAIAELDAL